MKTSSSYSAESNSVVLFPKNVLSIGVYYLHLIAALKVSERLNAEEKLGQLAFLMREWKSELSG